MAADYRYEGTRPSAEDSVGPLPGPVTLHIVPQAHIDLIWTWPRAETTAMILETFRGHVERLEADPARTFAQSQAWTYERVRREEPELFARIAALVREGRWECVGGEWVEADAVLPGPEARIRQYLLGQRYFEDHFGMRSRVGWCPDSFILLPRELPGVLRDAGIAYFIHKRPRERYMPLPLTPYRWIAPGGAEVLALRVNNKGNGLPLCSEGVERPEGASHLAHLAALHDRIGTRRLWAPMGVGDVGGVNAFAPAPVASEEVSREYGTPSGYFDAVAPTLHDLPEVRGDLRAFAFGSLTTWARTKALLRETENALQQLEALQAMHRLRGLAPDLSANRELWEELLFYQFHDSAGGCGTEPVRREMEEDLASCLRRVRSQTARHARRLAERAVPAAESSDGIAAVVFNPCGHPVTTTVCCPLSLIDPDERWRRALPPPAAPWEEEARDARQWAAPDVSLIAEGPDGSVAPVLIERLLVRQSRWNAEVRFRVEALPPFGYRAYRITLREGEVDALAKVRTERRGMRLGLATGRIEAELDLAAGCVVGWKENAPGGLHLAECRLGAPALHETGAYDVNYGKELRAWEDGLNGRKTVLSPSRHEILPLSGGRVAVAFEYESGNSLFRQEFLAAPGADALEVAFTGDWREIERFCKLHFRLGAEDPDAPEQTGFADRAYGFEDALPEGRESPMQYLCGVRDARRGVAILNDGRYGCRRVGGEVELSAIRCATYPARRSDAGPFRLTYRIRPFAVEPGWRLRLLREAFAYNVRPLAFAPETALASGPAAWSPALVEETTGLIHGLRPDVSGRRIALRLYNPGTEPMHARLHPPDPFPLAHGSNAIDDLGEALAPEATLAVHPHGVRTILFCKREDEA